MVLIVDNDLVTREIFATALRVAGFNVVSAGTGVEALSQARTSHFDAAVIDRDLPDMSGTDIVRALQATGLALPFIVMGNLMTTQITVDAMRLGACEVLDKPVAVATLCAVVARAVEGGETAAPPVFHPHSVAERWARLVVKACNADGDPKTLHEWAHVAGLSYTSLRELCRILGIRAHDARDLARMLRAVKKARLLHCQPQVFLDVSDKRTVSLLFARSGLDPATPERDLSVDDFLDRQRFVDAGQPALQILRLLLSSPEPIE
jgi:FixJ family two-component response regulator